MSFDFGDVFTVAVRHVVPVARSRGFSFAFDCQIAHLRLEGDPAGVQGALHKIFLQVLALMQSGSLVISATLPPGYAGQRLLVHVAGVGVLVADEAIAEARERLQLSMVSSDDKGFTAKGVCPHTGGAVEMSMVVGQGVLITLELPSAEDDIDDHQPDPSAHSARAWLVNVDDGLATAWTRRLQRLGWAVSRFSSYEAAAQQLKDAPQAARPALVIVLETANPAVDGTLDLPMLLPVWTRFIYAVETGSLTLRRPEAVLGYEVHVYPMSPDQLEAFTDEACNQELGTGTTMPMPLSTRDMPSVLIVDDTPLNLIVGRSLAEALGYHVRTAVDGLDAIWSCRQHAPHVVLMDLQMPRLDGIGAIRHLREMQREGHMPPFPIVIVTADWSPEIRTQCIAAGADDCLAKPLSLPEMANELSRIASYR